ncbi:MAG TPA: hypothetical protein VEQ60_14850 [Longimicrobium sp.]|nr:hypothetical protein [Longimicrobium sp.]
MRLITAQATVERVLVAPDVAAIFFAGFRWLQEQKSTVLDGWIRLERKAPVRHSDRFLAISPHFERLIEGAAASAGPGSAGLNETAFVRLRKLLTQLLSEAESDSDAALAVLALLVAIDERMGRAVRTQYYTRPEGTRSSVPVTRDHTMPKPWPAFSTRTTPFHRLAPGTGVDRRMLFLEHQFWRLQAPLVLAGPEGPRPALHRSGEPSSDEGVPCDWSVAAVDVLSAFEELELGEDEDHFWLQRYAADEIRDRVWEKLEWVMEVCREGGAQLIVIPELSLSRDLVARVAMRLGEWPQADSTGLLPMVIAGRLHEPVPGDVRGFKNRPAVITPDGELAWEYWKLRPFESAWLGGRSEVFGPDPEYVLAIDTPLGRVAVTICLDFPDYHVQSVLRELRASVVVVPAMTPGRTVEETFYDRAVALTSDCRAATIFANSSIPIRGEIQEEKDARERLKRDGEELGQAGKKADGAEIQPRPRTLSFVRGSTSISAGTPIASDDFNPDSSATVCVYHLHAAPGGRLSVTRDPPRHFPG